ncbi:ArsB/NhaD family transporter [Clostridium massiliamazoniense]|uniref:ArsB/NhaD family transporter n=1 Tax=Clostridium massiliamazoniense TaxID=1347366 RepID=UPI0006D80D8D|nr:ArsB/NhaD family transporter [Clostridium massiliamazoniense]
MNSQQILALAIFLIIIFAIISEKFDNTVLALFGAVLMIIFKIVPLEKAMSYVSFNTLAVLIGMMLIVAILGETGFFEFIAISTAKLCKGKVISIFFSLAVLTAFFSGILDNVTTVLLMGPVTFLITKKLNINPIPFVIMEIMASNIGGTTTLIGDPPNIMIGSAANLSFVDFIKTLMPVTTVILFITAGILYFTYRKKLTVENQYVTELLSLNPKDSLKDKNLLYKGLVIILFVLFGFIFGEHFGLSAGVIAITGATLYLLIARKPLGQFINHVEWSAILFFTGLFILVGGLESAGLIEKLAELILEFNHSTLILMLILLWLSALVSPFLDNIPFVATLIPLVLTLKEQGIDVTMLWWAISLGACLGGNGTLIGASANVVLAKVSESKGYKISFIDYFKVGFPLMILSIIISMAYLLIIS